MSLDWMDVSDLSFNTIFLLERVQLEWFSKCAPIEELAIALQANPAVEWFIRHKCPDLNDWIDRVIASAVPVSGMAAIRKAEMSVLAAITDMIVYAVDPGIYDTQPFLKWDSNELLSLVDFSDKVVIDVGAGTGRLSLAIASQAESVFAVEPVGNLRTFLKQKSLDLGFRNIFPMDGLITEIQFPDRFADVTMSGHVFGDDPEEEAAELHRVTKSGGMIILCPGNSDKDNDIHSFLISQGYNWSRFEEPVQGWKRKYWKQRA